METLLLKIQPLTAFGGPIKGDTLFGQLCWSIAHRQGEAFLLDCLKGYTDGDPFLICSDAFPSGHLPRPVLPFEKFDPLPGEDRKLVKKRQWLPVERLNSPLPAWLAHCCSESEVAQKFDPGAHAVCQVHPQPHNSIHRVLNTTHSASFAPYTQKQYWFAQNLVLDIWLLFDSQRIAANQVTGLFKDLGQCGFGRDAGIGLGKFAVKSAEAVELPAQAHSNAMFTLAPCAPQGLGLQAEHCYYEPFTRFGRHGDRAVLSGRPFKNPLLLVNTAAVLTGVAAQTRAFVGQGLGGDGKLSNAIAGTVHQGYAPCIGVKMEDVAE